MPSVIVADISLHLDTFTTPEAEALVFTSPHGKPLRHPNHTGNMLAADAGANLRELMERMGHSTTRAATVYLHGGTERQQAIADELSRQAAEQLGRSKAARSGTQRARRRGSAS